MSGSKSYLPWVNTEKLEKLKSESGNEVGGITLLAANQGAGDTHHNDAYHSIEPWSDTGNACPISVGNFFR